jgi:hypothetical protein
MKMENGKKGQRTKGISLAPYSFLPFLQLKELVGGYWNGRGRDRLHPLPIANHKPTKTLLVAIGPVFTSSHPEQRS